MKYVPLRITTVKANSSLKFDLYIYFKEHYLCYAEKGVAIDEEKLEKLVKQEVADFFVPADQIDNVNVFMDETLTIAIANKDLSVEEKVDIVEGVAASSIEHMQENPTQKNYGMTRRAASGLRQVIKENPQALKRLFGEKAKESDLIIKHSMNVCALATRLAEHLRIPDEEIEDLATASLIHDIGLTQLNYDDLKLFEKDKDDLEPPERLNYGQHAKISAQILSEKPFISKRVEELVLNHEEDLLGNGPYKVRKLTTAQECLSLCNAFDKRLITTKETPKDAYKKFQVDYIGRYNLELIQRFEMVLKEEGLI